MNLQFRLPPSDVIGDKTPYRIGIVWPHGADAAEARVHLTLRRTEGQKDDAVTSELTVPLPASAGEDERCMVLEVSGADLAEGEYAGMMTVTSGETTAEQEFSFFRMPQPLGTACPFTIYAPPAVQDPEEIAAMLKHIRALGITILTPHMFGLDKHYLPLLDAAARWGITFQPSMRYWTPDVRPAAWEGGTKALLGDGTPAGGRKGGVRCLNHPDYRAWARGNVTRYLSAYQQHPAFSGIVYFGDDLFLHARISQGEARVSCYCERCTTEFERRTGQKAPTAPPRRRGVVADDDPWLLWTRFRCARQYAGFIEAIETARKEVAPAVPVGLCHGFPDNPFVSLAHGLYGPLTQPGAVVSSYCYPFLRSPAADFICHYEIARMGNRDKPVWMLGVCGADRVTVPGWHVRQNYWNMLAAGYDLIGFFSWHDYHGLLKSDDAEVLRRAGESMAALAQCGVHKDWILPVAQHWQRPRAPFAALYSFTTEAFDIGPEFRGHLHSKRICEFYRLALQARVPLEIICEEEIRDGILERYEALCLRDVRALAGEVKVIVDAYAAQGKLVLLDRDELYTDGWHPNTRVEVEGGVEVAPATMIQLLRDRSEPAAVVSNPDVTMRRFTAGEVEYYVFVNNYPDRYWGMTYSYGNPEANYARADLVRDEPVQAKVRFAEAKRRLFDMSTGAALGSSAEELLLDLEPSWGRVIVALPGGEAVLNVEAQDHAAQGEAVRWGLTMQGEDGRALRGAFAVRVTVTTPGGRQSRCSGFLGLRGGKGEFVLPLGYNDETGVWQLVFAGGFPRREVTCTLEVRPGKAGRTLLRPAP